MRLKRKNQTEIVKQELKRGHSVWKKQVDTGNDNVRESGREKEERRRCGKEK